MASNVSHHNIHKAPIYWWQNLLCTRIALHFPLVSLKSSYQLFLPHSFYHHWSCVALFGFDFLVCMLSLIHSVCHHGPFSFSQKANHSKMVIFCWVSGWDIKYRVIIEPTAITHSNGSSVCLKHCMQCSCTKHIHIFVAEVICCWNLNLTHQVGLLFAMSGNHRIIVLHNQSPISAGYYLDAVS